MKIHTLLAGSILVALLASCSASNKADQTVDDVYYSPGRAAGVDQPDNKTQNDYAYNSEDDNYLKMMVQNRAQWSTIDDYAYWNSYNTSSFGMNVGYSNFYSNYWNNSYYGYNYNYYPYLSYNYNPYSSYGYTYGSYYPYNSYGSTYYNTGVYIKGGRANTGAYVNLGAYQNHTFSNQNYSSGHSSFSNGNTPQTGVGRLLRTIVTGSNTPDTYNPARTFSSPNTSTYSPSSSSSSSSAPAAASSRTSSTSGGGGRRN